MLVISFSMTPTDSKAEMNFKSYVQDIAIQYREVVPGMGDLKLIYAETMQKWWNNYRARYRKTPSWLGAGMEIISDNHVIAWMKTVPS